MNTIKLKKTWGIRWKLKFCVDEMALMRNMQKVNIFIALKMFKRRLVKSLNSSWVYVVKSKLKKQVFKKKLMCLLKGVNDVPKLTPAYLLVNENIWWFSSPYASKICLEVKGHWRKLNPLLTKLSRMFNLMIIENWNACWVLSPSMTKSNIKWRSVKLQA